MDDDWDGHPLRKDYPIGGEPVRFSGEDYGRRRTRQRTPIYEGSRIPVPTPTVLRVDAASCALGRHPHDQLRPEPPVHARRAAPRRRPRRRAGRRPRGGRRLPPHRLREDHGAEDVVEGDHVPRADRLRLLPVQRARRSFSRSRNCSSSRCRGSDLDADAALRADPDPLASRLARDLRARARRDLDLLGRVPPARPDPRPLRDGRRHAHAHALLPGRRSRRGHPSGLLRRVRASSSSACRRRSTTTRRSSTATPSGSSAPRASASCPPRTLSPSDSPARCCAPRASTGICVRAQPYLAYDQVDFRVPVYYERRRLGPLQAGSMDEMRESTRIVSQARSRACPAGRGSPTTARSPCRHARSCTPRWRR